MVLDKYINECVDVICKMDTKMDRKDVEKQVISRVKRHLQDPTIIMDNNVTGDNERITLTRLCNWIDNKQPVVSGNGTFYCQPDVIQSPTSNMLRAMKKNRSKVKHEMFNHSETSNEYKNLDLSQLNIKVVMNAEYGGSGAKSAAFYTPYSPPATTLMAQSIITVMANFFEGIIGDNQKFWNANELFEWINTIISKDTELYKWVKVPNIDEVLNRLKSHCVEYDYRDTELIRKYLSNCTDREITLIYYANNMHEFIRNHTKVSSLIGKILENLPLYEAVEDSVPEEFKDKFKTVKKYNGWVSKEMFLNPYSIPDCISNEIETFIKYLVEYVYVDYINTDSIIKLNNHKRNTVIIVDTDSNVINSDMFVRFVLDELYPGQTFGRDRMYNDMICVNILAATVDVYVKKMLSLYARCHNINDDDAKELTMKNEFMFRKLLLVKTKKRYGSSIILREGNIMLPAKLDLKGFDFRKAGVTEEVENRFAKMLSDNVLYSDELQLKNMMIDLKNFTKEIREDLRNGGTSYLKPQSYKPVQAYKVSIKKDGTKKLNAWTQQVFRGSQVWNILYPDNKIYSMDRVKIVKLRVTKPDQIEYMKNTEPKLYQTIMNQIFGSDTPELAKTGISVICIPQIIDTIPSWMIPLLDYDIITSNIVASYRSVLEGFDIEGVSIKTPHGHANVVTNLISI